MPFDVPFDLSRRRVWVAGHGGMVGSALVRRLKMEDCAVLTVDRAALDLREQAPTRQWVADHKPDVVIIAAGTVGGILANASRPASFISDNLLIQSNIVDAAFRNNVAKLLFLGSSCAYPRLARQPITEDELLAGPLEPTNEWYAIAKIAGIKLCQAYRRQYLVDYISAIPTNMYGPGDNYDLKSSHVLPALLRKAHEAKIAGSPAMVMWGDGVARREFLYVDDCADACVHLLKRYSKEEPINVGRGEDITIGELAHQICKTVGYEGELVMDAAKPNGTPQKLLDISRIRTLGWEPVVPLNDGLRMTYDAYLADTGRHRT